MIDENTSLRDLAGAVAAGLRKGGNDPVVVGGSAAAIQAPEAYRSHDVDMVIPFVEREARGAFQNEYVSRADLFFHRIQTRDAMPANAVLRYGFTTAVTMLFRLPPTQETAQRTAHRAQQAVRKNIAAIDTRLTDIVVRAVPYVLVNGQRVVVALELHASENLAFVEKLSVAIAVQEQLRDSVGQFPELEHIVVEHAPAITTIT